MWMLSVGSWHCYCEHCYLFARAFPVFARQSQQCTPHGHGHGGQRESRGGARDRAEGGEEICRQSSPNIRIYCTAVQTTAVAVLHTLRTRTHLDACAGLLANLYGCELPHERLHDRDGRDKDTRAEEVQAVVETRVRGWMEGAERCAGKIAYITALSWLTPGKTRTNEHTKQIHTYTPPFPLSRKPHAIKGARKQGRKHASKHSLLTVMAILQLTYPQECLSSRRGLRPAPFRPRTATGCNPAGPSLGRSAGAVGRLLAWQLSGLDRTGHQQT